MIFKYCRFLFTAVLCFIINEVWAQAFKQLTVNDFLGAPQINNRGVVAYTNCTINFTFQASRQNNSYRLHANVRLYMNSNKSWIDKSRIISAAQLAEILNHEQGHYTIAYLEQQEILTTIATTRFTANYTAEAMAIFNRIDAKYKQLNSDYESDTRNMTDRQQQHSWDIYFAKRLQQLSQGGSQ